MSDISAVIIYQPYEPFDALLPEILWDLHRQTIDIKVYISGQPAVGLIEKGKLYDKRVDKIDTEFIFFTDVDAKLPSDLMQSLLVNIEDNDLDIVFCTLPKRPDYRKVTDGIFILRKDMWLDFRKTEEYETFLTAKGIPTYLPLFIKWCAENKRIGYEFDCPVGLRLPGNSARKHQHHQATKSRAYLMAKELRDISFIAHWSLIDGVWQQSPPAKDNRV